MSTTITAITTAIISAITVIFSIWYKDYLTRKYKDRHTVNTKDKSMFYIEMDKTCSTIRKLVNADGSYLAYFHNGGTFNNGISMDKFTVVGEDYNTALKDSYYKKLYYATMINYMSFTYHKLIIENKYAVAFVNNLPDLSFKNDLIKRGVKSILLFLIKDPITEKPIGFFALEFVNYVDVSKIEEGDIWKYQNKLSRLLNMTVLNENEK